MVLAAIGWSRGFTPGLHSRDPSGRSRCAAVSGSRGCTSESRGCTSGFIPAAFQAAVGARRCRVPGVAPRSPGVAPRSPGVARRASFPRPFRPPESGRSIGVVPGLHHGLHSRGPSGRSRSAAVSGSRGCTSESRGCTSETRGCTTGFIPAALQAAGERAIDWRCPRGAPSLLPTSQPPPVFASGPNVSHAQARSCIRWRPIQTVCVPGSLFGRSM